MYKQIYSLVILSSFHSVTGNLLKVQQNIGYCPQFDALYDQLTAREHLQLYSRLRGIPPKDERQVSPCGMEVGVKRTQTSNLRGFSDTHIIIVVVVSLMEY